MRHANGRVRSASLLGVAALVGVALLTGCDTGDGKELKAFDPADYPSQTVPPTTVELGVDEFGSDVLASDALAGGGSALPGAPGDANAEPFTVIAPWPDQGAIDIAYTCDGDNISPAVSWGAVPAGTVEIAIALVDDSAVNDGEPFVHWVIGALDPAEIALVDGDVPPGAIQALNFFGDVGYGGPCPPPGDEPHEYRLTAFALAQQLELPDGAPATEFLEVISVTAFASAEVTGLFQR